MIHSLVHATHVGRICGSCSHTATESMAYDNLYAYAHKIKTDRYSFHRTQRQQFQKKEYEMMNSLKEYILCKMRDDHTFLCITLLRYPKMSYHSFRQQK